MSNPNCEVGYHVWRSHPGYSECEVCHLIERDQKPTKPETGARP